MKMSGIARGSCPAILRDPSFAAAGLFYGQRRWHQPMGGVPWPRVMVIQRSLFSGFLPIGASSNGFLHFGQRLSQDYSKNRIQISFISFMTIYVGNLSFDAEAEDVQHLFGEYGTVKKCTLPLDRETGRKRGFAFVDMSSDAEETKAIDDLQNVEGMGRSIRVNNAEPRPSGGGGGGGGGNRW